MNEVDERSPRGSRRESIEIAIGAAVIRATPEVDWWTGGLGLPVGGAARGEAGVIMPPPEVRVFVATRPVDFRKGMDR